MKVSFLQVANQRMQISKIKLLKNSVKVVSLIVTMMLSSFALSDNHEKTTIAPGADIRMLIDISGSMKKNDPANLRIPAVNLLTELIPDGDQAGVWTFGQWVNNLIKHKDVDDAWRADAKEKAKKINSVALFTNIGAVLEKSADDFYKKDKDFSNTHFILLTDGMVDIDKDPAKNATERERILTQVLKTFKDKGAKIHTVSLSKNADQALMEKLAVQTGGQSALAENPEDLTRIFLQALDQAVPSEQVPIEGNEFVIDSSIEEFTALIFRGDSARPTEIIAPDETVITYENRDNEDVKWYQDSGYDLITITRPVEGTWTINADVQPGSRVTVVSNLQLNVTKLPVNFFAGDILDVEVSFTEDGQLVTNKEFLSLLDVDLQLKTESNKTAKKSMSEPGVPNDGIYRESITKLSKTGQYEVTVLVDGKTFKRKKRQVINLRPPFDFEFSVKGEGAGAYYELVVSPMSDSIELEETNIFAKINAPDGSSLINAIELDEASGRWIMPIRNDKGDGTYIVATKVKARTSAGKVFKFKPEPFEAEFPVPAGAANAIVSSNEEEDAPEELPEETLKEEPKPEPEEKEEPEPEPEQKEEPKPEPVKQVGETEVEEEIEASDETVDLVEEDDNAIWLLVGGGALAALLLIGGAVFYFMKKRKTQDDDEEVLSDADIEEISEELEDGGDKEPEADGLDFVEEPPEEVPVLDEVTEEPEPVSAVPEELLEEDDELDAPLVDIEDEEMSEEVSEEPEPSADDDIADLAEELSEDIGIDDPDEDASVDLSSDDLADVVDDLESEGFDETILEDAEDMVDEEDLAADIAQAIEDAADEPEEELGQEIEDALDLEEDDDDDEEFNLEDFDIGDTDDLEEDDEDKK